MNARTSGQAFRFNATPAHGARALSGSAPAAACSPSFTVFPLGTGTSAPPVIAAGGNTPWG
ncbi:hypothetical protein GCM10022226_82580 [Sphaerisporangium flaviroseum]|uniref:Uncharacterized protein n=1 Tax=Sphaerisporangium flaviroseum TaxID=509199 RepID=A0ABP7JK69_9ACTN